MKVLIVEDNRALAKNIKEYFGLKSIKADVAFDGIMGMQVILDNHYDVIILDINLPGKDGLTICKELREKEINTPILILTSRNTTTDVVTGLNLGADDYLGKPFDFEELISRIEALNRRNFSNKNSNIIIGNIEINPNKRLVTKGGEEIQLSTIEFDLLKFLAQNKGTPIDRKTLFENVWGDFDSHMLSRTVDVHIGTLRKKIGAEIIETRKGFGYLIK
ncbi:MAG: response regulator transcription factor [Candidatus Gracilibacteria bacterium]|nr:response regulator transcription factor [Candidatus Gracilibacteria bacterium]MDD2908923.1 response regulator transcription factor [Candidatus Gracilibacteria bacterium]